MLEAKYSRDNQKSAAGQTDPGAAEAELWGAKTGVKHFAATVNLPGSKSLMARELVLSALANGPSKIFLPLDSRDSQLMIEALSLLGTEFERQSEVLTVIPTKELTGSTSIACGLAGTVMRFVPAVAALALGPTVFDGDPYARLRPMSALIGALRDLGADIADEGRGALPFTVHGTGSVNGGEVEIDASSSSQYVSALLLAGARFDSGVTVKHTGAKLPSIPHIEMTIDCLVKRGVEVLSPAPGVWQVAPGEIAGREVTIEPDLSNAAPFLAAALVSEASVTVNNWPSDTTQVGDQLRTILPKFGAKAQLKDGALTVSHTGPIRATDLHVPDAGELAPTLVGLAALADGPSTITGIGHIRHHETDRIKALINELEKIGCRVVELADGLEIHPATSYTPTVWQSYDDHRMATTGALIGLAVAGMQVQNIASTSKTMPDFANMWQNMLAGTEVL